MSDSLRPHGLQHARPPCPSPTPRVYSNSCSLSRWCHPTISSSVVPFSSCLQSFPASGSFPMNQFFASGGQSFWSFSFSIGPSNEYSWLISFRMDWLDLLAVQRILKSLLQHYISKTSILQHSAFFIVQLSHPYMTTGKTIALTRWIFVDKVMSLLFNMLSRLVITFLPRSKRLLISWLQSPSAVILEPRKIKSVTVSPSNSCAYKPHSPISALSVKKRGLRFLAALSFCLTFTWLRSWSWKRNIAYWALSSAHRGFLCTTDCILYTQQVLFNTQLMCNFISNISQGLANVHYRITGKKNLSSLEENPKGFNLLRLA